MKKRHNHFRIRKLRAEGLTWTQIQEAVGCCRYTVWLALQDDIDKARESGRKRQQKFRERHDQKARQMAGFLLAGGPR